MMTARKTALIKISILLSCAALFMTFARVSFAYAKEYNIDYDPAYGYGSLNENMKRLYDDMLNDIENMLSAETDITSPSSKYGAIEYKPLEAMTYKCSDYGLDYPMTCSVFSALRLLHPEYYFLPGIVLKVNSGESLRLTIISEYATAAARDKADELIERAKADILTGIDELPSDYEKVLELHDRIINTIDYAYDAVGEPESAHWAHSIIGAVSNNKAGVCETYVKWFNYLLLESDIESYIVTGICHGQNHAWNIVKLDDGKWYDFDLTLDENSTSDKTGIYYGYFAAPSSVFDENHTRTPDDKFGIDFLYKIPKAENTYKYNYYSVRNAIPDCSNDNQFTAAYADLWKKALENGSRTIKIYVKNNDDLQYVLSKYADLNPIRSKLHDMGINDDISINGGATILNNHVVCIYINSSSFCPNSVKHSYTEMIATDEYLKSPADCKRKAVYYYACKYCGQKATATYEYGEVTSNHRLSYTPAVEPDCENGGNAEYWFCSVCGNYFADKDATRVLEYNDIDLKAYGHIYGSASSAGEKEHQYACERCGKVLKEAHEWDEGKVISKPSMTNSGITLYTCKTCGGTREVSVAYEGHVHFFPENFNYDENNHWRECSCGEKTDLSAHDLKITEDDNEKTVYSCTVCDYKKTIEKEQPHVHVYGDWKPYNADTHRRQCVDGDSEETKPHVWKLTDEHSDRKVKILTYTCTVCGETKTETENIADEPHVHSYGEWKPYDPQTHRRVCVDGDSEKTEPHAWSLTDELSDGHVKTLTYTCTVCGETRIDTENEPVPTHDWKLTDELSDEYVKTLTYTCTVCGETKTETEKIAYEPEHIHTYGVWQSYDPEVHRRVCIDGDSEETEPHDFIVSSVNTEKLVRSITYVCSVCGETFTETEQLPDDTSNLIQLIVIFIVSALIVAGAAVAVVIIIKRKKTDKQTNK